MTLDQFLEALKDAADSGDHTFVLDGDAITTVENEDCPIHAVWQSSYAGHKEGMLEDWSEEADRMGISGGVAKRIIDASDNRGNPKLRKKLLKACGIKKRKTAQEV
jgi:hypothetical protein